MWYSILIGWRLGWRNTRFWLADEVEGSFRAQFWLADETWGFLVPDSDCLPTIVRFWAQAECVRQYIKIGNGVNDSFSALWHFFEKNFWTDFFSCRPVRADNYYKADYLWRLWLIFTLADTVLQCEKILRQCIKIGYSSVMY